MAHWGINFVKQYERIVVFRWGRYEEVGPPGVRWLWPLANDGSRTVDLREVAIPVPLQTINTRDDKLIEIEFLVSMRVMEDRPQDAILMIGDFRAAAPALAATRLREVIHGMELGEIRSKREEINARLRLKLEEITTNWGVGVTRAEIFIVEIDGVEPHRDVQLPPTKAPDRSRAAPARSAAATPLVTLDQTGMAWLNGICIGESLDEFHERCGTPLIFQDGYDSVFCPTCNLWLDDKCGDPSCSYCAGRPDAPLPMEN